MKAGAENRRKTIIAGGLGAAGLVCVFKIYSTFFGGPDAPAPAPAAPVAVRATVPTDGAGNSRAASAQAAAQPGGVIPGVEAQKLASTSASLDPTLDEIAMLRTESLVYSGTGRNIFSATYTPPPAVVKPLILPSVNPRNAQPLGPPPPPPPPATCPPSCPPIGLKFFGTATRPNGSRQAFLLSGDDVYLAAQGDIVARKYKIVTISASSLSVTDLTNNNTQTLPLQTN